MGLEIGVRDLALRRSEGEAVCAERQERRRAVAALLPQLDLRKLYSPKT